MLPLIFNLVLSVNEDLFSFCLINIFFVFPIHRRGIGVIGQQPVILPQTSFEYSSACPLSTPTGRMVRCDTSLVFCSLKLYMKITFSWFYKRIQLEKPGFQFLQHGFSYYDTHHLQNPFKKSSAKP